MGRVARRHPSREVRVPRQYFSALRAVVGWVYTNRLEVPPGSQGVARCLELLTKLKLKALARALAEQVEGGGRKMGAIVLEPEVKESRAQMIAALRPFATFSRCK